MTTIDSRIMDLLVEGTNKGTIKWKHRSYMNEDCAYVQIGDVEIRLESGYVWHGNRQLSLENGTKLSQLRSAIKKPEYIIEKEQAEKLETLKRLEAMIT